MAGLFTKFFSRILSLILVSLGFTATACNDTKNDDLPAPEYGVPTAEFRIRGTAVDEYSSRPVEGLRAVMVKGNAEKYDRWISDTVYTDTDGRFNLSVHAWPEPSGFLFKIEDIGDQQNVSYGDYSRTVNFYGKFTGPEGNWFEGSEIVDLGSVKIRRMENDE